MVAPLGTQTPPHSNRPNATALNTNGFSPEIWGPGMWQTMHMIAATFPEHPTQEQSRQYYTFFASLANVLPCRGCREEYAEMIRGGGPLALTSRTVSGRMPLFAWTVAVHDAVNARLGKPHGTDWRAWYRHYDSAR